MDTEIDLTYPQKNLVNRLKSQAKNAKHFVEERLPKLPKTAWLEVEGAKAKFAINNPTEALRVKTLMGEKEFLKSFLETVNPGAIVVDVGASIGTFSIMAAAKGAKQVFAVEPDTESAFAVIQNAQLNGFTNIKVAQVPLAETDGEVIILETSGTSGHSPRVKDSNLNLPPQDYKKEIELEAISLPTFFNKQQIERVDVMKIDIEGQELKVLRSFDKTIHPTHLFIEVHSSMGVSFDEIKERLGSFGYTIVEQPINRGSELLCHFKL